MIRICHSHALLGQRRGLAAVDGQQLVANGHAGALRRGALQHAGDQERACLRCARPRGRHARRAARAWRAANLHAGVHQLAGGVRVERGRLRRRHDPRVGVACAPAAGPRVSNVAVPSGDKHGPQAAYSGVNAPSFCSMAGMAPKASGALRAAVVCSSASCVSQLSCFTWG